jgi:putative transposase
VTGRGTRHVRILAPSLVTVLREYEDFCSTHRLHRTLKQAAPLRPLPGNVTGLDRFRVQRCDRAGGVIHEYRLVA